jgi:hypothetical protein
VSRIRLTRKLAATLNGLDVSNVSLGEVFDVSAADAAMMVAEGWAQPIAPLKARPGHRGRVAVPLRSPAQGRK